MIVVLERSFPEERLFASTSDITLTDLLSSGIFKSVSDEKRALLLKRMNAALHKVKKPE
jgi:hypothetical protein